MATRTSDSREIARQDTDEEFAFPRADAAETPFGWRWTLVAATAVSVAAALGVGYALATAGGLPVFGTIIGLALAFGALLIVPQITLSGQRVDQALSRGSRRAWNTSRGRRKQSSTLPTDGARTGVENEEGYTARQLAGHKPAELDGIDLLQVVTPSQKAVAVLHDTRTDGYTAVMQVRPAASAQFDPDRFAAVMESWTALLASLDTGVIRRVQVTQVSCPDVDGTELYRFFDANRTGGDDAAEADYLEALAAAGPSSTVHEAFIAIEVDGAAAGRRGIRKATRRTRDARAGRQVVDTVHAAERALLAECAAFADRAGRGGLQVVDAMLSPRRLAEVWRCIYQPGDRPEVLRRNDIVETAERGVSWLVGAFPADTADDTDWYDTDGTRHSVWWVENYPQAGHAKFLQAMLLAPSVPRVFTFTLQMLPAAREGQRAGQRRTWTGAAAKWRAQKEIDTSSERAAADAAADRYEAAIAAGWPPLLMSAYAVASAAPDGDLGVAEEELRAAAARSGVVLNRLRGHQRMGFAYGLPGVTRGVGGRSGSDRFVLGGDQ